MPTIPSGGCEREDEHVWPGKMCAEATKRVDDSCYKIHKMDRYPTGFFDTLTDAEQRRWLVGHRGPRHPHTDAYFQCILAGHETLRQFDVCL